MENKLDGYSMDLEMDNKEKLKAVFPECFAEGKLDIDKLLSLCGEYIDEDFEKYKFEWKGKANCLKLAQQRSRGTLRPKIEDSVNFDTTENLYIEGENLEVLKLLQTAYYRKVKMIYIDPPYNTGNDFVYEDDFKDSIAKYKEVTSQATKSNPESMGRFHTNWLNMIYPRLRLASNLLTDDGVIFISIDDNEVFNLKKVCDEVFGEENFIADIIWKHTQQSKNDEKFFSRQYNHTIVYAKQVVYLQKFMFERTDEDNKNYSNPDNDPKGLWRSGDVRSPNYRKTLCFDILAPDGKIIKAPLNGWRWTEDNIKRKIDIGEIIFKNDNSGIIRKIYLCNQEGRTPENLWQGERFGTTRMATSIIKYLFEDKIVFDTPKPIELIISMLKMTTNSNDIILDFFSGSATTAHAVMQLNAEDGGNRKFICVQLPEVTPEDSEAFKNGYKNICEIGKERIRRAGTKILEETPKTTIDERENPLDIGFKALSLDTSNLYDWDNSSMQKFNYDEFANRLNSMITSIKEDRTDMDMIFEIMIKMGVTLDTPITHVEINDKIAYVVGDYLLLICLAPLMTVEDVETMIELAPAKIVMAERSFINDSIISNAYYLLENAEIEFKLI